MVQKPRGFNGATPVFDGVDHLHPPRRLPAQRQRLSGQRRRLLPRWAFRSIRPPATWSAASPRCCNSPTTSCRRSATSDHLSTALNLPTSPATAAYSASIPNSELLEPGGFQRRPRSDDCRHRTGDRQRRRDLRRMNRSSGGAVTVYDATGTPANMQLRWAKTDSVANGGTDTWQLFYQIDSNATGATVAWQNAGTAFKFDATGQLNPPVTSLALTGVTINGIALGNITVNMADRRRHAIRRCRTATRRSTSCSRTASRPGSCRSISVGNNGRIDRHLLQRPERRRWPKIPLAQFQQRQRSQAHRRRRLRGDRRIRRRDLPAPPARSSASRWKAPTPTSPTEFTKLIVTQQAYSANTRVITTGQPDGRRIS